jgi:CRP/FNR family cyclic AMP-dependent transcriptional regulator
MPGGVDPESESLFLLAEPTALSEPIRRLGASRRYRKSEFVYRQGSHISAVYEVISGQVTVSTAGPENAERVLSIAGPGAGFGESGCFDGLPAYASARASVDSRILVIPRSAVIEAGTREPAILIEMMRRLARKQRLMHMHVVADGLSARGKLLLLLDHMAAAYGQAQPDGTTLLRVKPTIEEMAAMMGVTRVTMSRAVSALVEDGVIAKRGRALVILDTSAVPSAGGPVSAG